MSSQSLVCTGCSCLCDDLRAEVAGTSLCRIENACAKGTAYLRSAFDPKRRASSSIRGRPVSLDEALTEAARLLSRAKNQLVFGLESATLEAQAVAIELAHHIGGAIDGASSFSCGTIIQSLLSGDLPTVSLAEAKDKADLLIYWGSNPPHTHPRHLSRFTYYAYTDYDPAGWYPRVTLSCVEVRNTELSSMCRPAFKIKPGGDKDFIDAILQGASGGSDGPGAFADMVKKSRFCVIFPGPSLAHSLGGDFTAFREMVRRFGEETRMAVIPMVAGANQRGFNQSLYQQTGYVDQVSFAGRLSHGWEFSFLEQVRKRVPECVLIIGSDPFSALPPELIANLEGVNIICLDCFTTPTTDAATVVIPTSLPGLEDGGSMLRMDGDKVVLTELIKGEYLTAEGVLKRLAEGVG